MEGNEDIRALGGWLLAAVAAAAFAFCCRADVTVETPWSAPPPTPMFLAVPTEAPHAEPTPLETVPPLDPITLMPPLERPAVAVGPRLLPRSAVVVIGPDSLADMLAQFANDGAAVVLDPHAVTAALFRLLPVSPRSLRDGSPPSGTPGMAGAFTTGPMSASLVRPVSTLRPETESPPLALGRAAGGALPKELIGCVQVNCSALRSSAFAAPAVQTWKTSLTRWKH